MNDNERRYSQWTVETLKQHFDALNRAEEKFQQERDRRYTERDASRSTALEAALRTIEKSTDILAAQYRADKAQQNEWRATINDIISKMGGSKAGSKEMWGYVAFTIGLILTVLSILSRFVK